MNDDWKKLTFELKQQAIRRMEPPALQQLFALSTDEIERLKRDIDIGPHQTGTLRSEFATPDKRSLREASRDFDLDLIFAELIDNSLDRFLKDPHQPGDELKIDITFDVVLSTCVYEDNAGGFRPDTLINFFRPGGTENLPGVKSIGSYAWGAKKSRAALASSVELLSRAAGQPACLGKIKPGWDEDDRDWSILVGVEGHEFSLDQRSQIAEGHTRLTFKDLKPLVLEHLEPFALEQLRKSLGEVYALIIAGHPNAPQIKLSITLEAQPVNATYPYLWTVFNEDGYDLRPHRYRFLRKVMVPFGEERQEHELEIVLEIGIKQGTGCATPGITESEHFNTTDDWGIDVYGNGRMIQRNVRGQVGITESYLKDNASKLVKGRLILSGPSHAIPWDTHKTRLASIHPALPVINGCIGPFVVAYLRAAQQAAGRGTDLENAVNKFKAKPWNAPPWNSQWSIVENGTTISLDYDEGQNVAAPAPGGGTEPGGQPPAGGVAPPAGEGETPPTGPVQGGPETGPPTQPAQPAQPPVTGPGGPPPQTGGHAPAPPVPVTPPRRGHGARTQKWVKFSVTETERQELIRWFRCPVRDIGDKVKEKLLAVKASEEAVAVVPQPQAPNPADGIRGLRELRQMINDPEVVAKLQQHHLSTIGRIREAGQAGLIAAGLTEQQATTVLGRVVNG